MKQRCTYNYAVGALIPAQSVVKICDIRTARNFVHVKLFFFVLARQKNAEPTVAKTQVGQAH